MQTFSLPTRLIFGENALEALKNASLGRVLVVTDPFFEQNGTAARIAALCGGESRIFSGVRPDPDMAQIAAGVAVLQQFAPDTLLALGGGSAIDCAKGILSLGQSKARLVAVPTTSGTGSEVTSFAVLTHNGVKYPLVEEGLRPAIAVLDPSLLAKLPAGLIADAGMDVLAHCLEAVAAKNATLFSDALAFFAHDGAMDVLGLVGEVRVGVDDRVLDLAGDGVVGRRVDALGTEEVQPRAGRRLIGQIGLVQQQHAALAGNEPVQIGIAAGIRQSGVAQLDHHIHAAELLGKLPFRLCHMSRVPVDIHVPPAIGYFLMMRPQERTLNKPSRCCRESCLYNAMYLKKLQAISPDFTPLSAIFTISTHSDTKKGWKKAGRCRIMRIGGLFDTRYPSAGIVTRTCSKE